jgi:hypothetical protein
MIGSEIILCFLAALTITGVAVVSARRSVVIVVMVLAAAGIALDWAAHFEYQIWLRILGYVVRLVFALLLAVIIMVQVFRRENVTHHRVQGAICLTGRRESATRHHSCAPMRATRTMWVRSSIRPWKASADSTSRLTAHGGPVHNGGVRHRELASRPRQIPTRAAVRRTLGGGTLFESRAAMCLKP